MLTYADVWCYRFLADKQGATAGSSAPVQQVGFPFFFGGQEGGASGGGGGDAAYADVCIRQHTSAYVCKKAVLRVWRGGMLRMLPYADVRRRILTYADVC